jgi:hypothetical protein
MRAIYARLGGETTRPRCCFRITSVYLQGIGNAEIIETVHARRAPMIPVSAWPPSS